MTYAEQLAQRYAEIRERTYGKPRRINIGPPLPPMYYQPVEMTVPIDVPSRVPPEPWKRMVLEVCVKHGVAFEDIVQFSRDHRVARWEAWYRLRHELRMRSGDPPSLNQIGRWFGGRDHSTILHGIQKHAESQ